SALVCKRLARHGAGNNRKQCRYEPSVLEYGPGNDAGRANALSADRKTPAPVEVPGRIVGFLQTEVSRLWFSFRDFPNDRRPAVHTFHNLIRVARKPGKSPAFRPASRGPHGSHYSRHRHLRYNGKIGLSRLYAARHSATCRKPVPSPLGLWSRPRRQGGQRL